MNKPSKPNRTRTLTLSDLRAVAGGETMSTISKSVQDAAKSVIQSIRG
jgi:hypothetical protein